MDWQSPTNHPLLMAQALSELIKRHFFTSPDAREKRRRKERGRRKEPEGGILLSLYPGLLVNKDFSQCPLLFLYPFILPWVEKRGRKEGEEKIVFPIMFCQVVFFFFFAIWKTIGFRWRMPPLNYSRSGRREVLLKCERLPGSQDPLEVLMKSVTLASQLYVSIHNPSPKTSP